MQVVLLFVEAVGIFGPSWASTLQGLGHEKHDHVKNCYRQFFRTVRAFILLSQPIKKATQFG